MIELEAEPSLEPRRGSFLANVNVVMVTYVVDGAFSGAAVSVGGVGALVRRAQNGFVRSYALSLLGGVLIVVLALLAVNLA